MQKYLLLCGALCLLLGSQVPSTNAQILPFLEWVQSFFGRYEEPEYTIDRIIADDIEERTYQSSNWSCVEEFFAARKRDEKTPEMFMILFSYIQGKNRVSRRIPMTIPVSTKVDHRNGEINSYEMCFYLPREFQTNPPVPNNSKVKIVNRPAMHVYARRFGGYASEAVTQDEFKNLTATLQNRRIAYFEEDQGPRATHYVNGYDAPTKFWNRRNEIWLLANPKGV